MRKKKPITDDQARIYLQLINEGSKLIRIFFYCATIVLIFKYVHGIAEVWADKLTMADIGIDIQADISSNIPDQLKELIIPPLSWIPGVLGAIFGWAGIIFGIRERDLRKTVVESMHQYQQKWEEMQDPERSTSRLTQRGDTRKEDH